MHGRDALKFKVTTPPTSEPVELSEVKAQLRIDADDDSMDDVLTPILQAAREWCEGYQNRAYITQTIGLVRDRWPHGDDIRLPRPPLQEVMALVYTDSDGAVTTVSTASYLVDTISEPGHLVAKDCWPSACLQETNAIYVTYVAGYGTASNVPQIIKQAIILLTLHWFENGMCEPPQAVKSMLSLDRVVPV